jgi:ribonucleoside-triphosphate reductase (thioredoxin)
MTELFDGKEFLSQVKFYTDYSRYLEDEDRWESWDDSVSRIMGMHRDFFADKLAKSEELRGYFDRAEALYRDKRVLASQRSLQFGGQPILKHNAKMYNCVVSYADRPRFFQEALYLLLCGCGVGFSVQNKHISKLPKFYTRNTGDKTIHVIEDSIEGWSDAVGILLSSFMRTSDAEFPHVSGKKVLFDYDSIRPKGAFISGGFKAPGPEGLRKSLELIEKLLAKAVTEEGRKLSSIEIYDIVMHCSDAVLSGGVRRSATICLFDADDNDMMNAKTGDWYVKNPQRARSNNSAVLLRGQTSRETFDALMKSAEQFGEPGFIWTYDQDILFNPLKLAA